MEVCNEAVNELVPVAGEYKQSRPPALRPQLIGRNVAADLFQYANARCADGDYSPLFPSSDRDGHRCFIAQSKELRVHWMFARVFDVNGPKGRRTDVERDKGRFNPMFVRSAAIGA